MPELRVKVTKEDIEHLDKVEEAYKKFHKFCMTRQEEESYTDPWTKKESRRFKTKPHSSIPHWVVARQDIYNNQYRWVCRLMQVAAIKDSILVLDDWPLIEGYRKAIDPSFEEAFVTFMEGVTEPFPEEIVRLPEPEPALVLKDMIEKKPWYKFW